MEKDVEDKDKALKDKEQETEELQGRLDDQDREIEDLQERFDEQIQEIAELEQDEYRKDVISDLESELMIFNADNSKFILECDLEEEKERTSHLEQAKAGLETVISRYKMQYEAALEITKEQEGKIHHLEMELVEEKTLNAGSKDAKKKLDRLEKQWAGVRRIMDEKPEDVFIKEEVKREEN